MLGMKEGGCIYKEELVGMKKEMCRERGIKCWESAKVGDWAKNEGVWRREKPTVENCQIVSVQNGRPVDGTVDVLESIFCAGSGLFELMVDRLSESIDRLFYWLKILWLRSICTIGRPLM